jgi:hypothetical protein
MRFQRQTLPPLHPRWQGLPQKRLPGSHPLRRLTLLVIEDNLIQDQTYCQALQKYSQAIHSRHPLEAGLGSQQQHQSAVLLRLSVEQQFARVPTHTAVPLSHKKCM